MLWYFYYTRNKMTIPNNSNFLNLFSNISSTFAYYVTCNILLISQFCILVKHYNDILYYHGTKKLSYCLCFSTCCAWFLVTFRKHNVSSNALHPTWIPYVAAKAGEEQLHFSLKLMTGMESSSVILFPFLIWRSQPVLQMIGGMSDHPMLTFWEIS